MEIPALAVIMIIRYPKAFILCNKLMIGVLGVPICPYKSVIYIKHSSIIFTSWTYHIKVIKDLNTVMFNMIVDVSC